MLNAVLLQQIRFRRALLARRPRRRKRLPIQLPPSAVILFYRGRLLSLLADAQARLRARLIPELERLSTEARTQRGDSERADAGGKKVKELVAEVRAFFERAHPRVELEGIAREVATRTSGHQREQLNRQVRVAVGVDVLASEPNLAPMVENFVEQNVSLLTSIPNRLFDDVEQRVQAGVTQGLRHEDLAKEIQERFGVSESRAELIARDQTLTFFGSLNEVRQKGMGVTSYTWRTSLDERVRVTHAAREGKTYDWADADNDIIPGEEVNCRCSAEPLLDELLENL